MVRASVYLKSLTNSMPKKYLAILNILIVGVTLLALNRHQRKPTELMASVDEFGPLAVGSAMIVGPNDTTFAPYLKIPAAKFYVAIINDELWCINSDCGLDGALIQTMGGWLQVENTRNYPDLPSLSGLDLEEHRNIKSLVIIGNASGTIVGIYPNKKLSDVMDILKEYPDLAHFAFLNGVHEFGSLAVGEFAPLKPGDRLKKLANELSKNSPTQVPKGKSFYIYALQKRKYDKVGIYEKYENTYVCLLSSCRYPEPDPPHDFLFAEIDKLNGWFLANSIEDREIIELFNMRPEEVLSGKTSLVVVTDSSGVILALHPNKTLSDTFTILSQIFPTLLARFFN